MKKKMRKNIIVSMVLSVILAFGMTEAAYCGSFTHTDTATHTATGIVNLTVSEEYSIKLPALLTLEERRDPMGELCYKGTVKVGAKLRILPTSCIHVALSNGCTFSSTTIMDENGNPYEVEGTINAFTSTIYSKQSAVHDSFTCDQGAGGSCLHVDGTTTDLFVPNDGAYHNDMLEVGMITIMGRDIPVPDEYSGNYTITYWLEQ